MFKALRNNSFALKKRTREDGIDKFITLKISNLRFLNILEKLWLPKHIISKDILLILPNPSNNIKFIEYTRFLALIKPY